MPFVPTPGGIEVVINQRLLGNDLVNVLNFEHVNPGDGVVLAALATLVMEWFRDGPLTDLSNDLTLVSVEARDISVEGGQTSLIPATGQVTGGLNNGSLPGNVAFCITHRSSRSGRSYRGRTYIAGLAEQSVTGNTLDSGVATFLQNAFNGLRADADEMGATFSIKSLYLGGVLRIEGVLTPVATSVARDLKVDTQRRRLS